MKMNVPDARVVAEILREGRRQGAFLNILPGLIYAGQGKQIPVKQVWYPYFFKRCEREQINS
jgi:hypothetical protein